jgi:PAS domain S-box-containing protein
MSRLSFSSLRVRLLVFVFIAISPPVGLTLYSDLEQRRLAASGVQQEALRLARLAANSQERLIAGAHQLLVTLARLPEMHAGDPVACSTLLASLLRQSPYYTNLSAIKPDGVVFCSAVPTKGVVNLADQAFFRHTLEKRDFAIGGPLIGPITGRPVIVTTYPVLDETDQVVAVVAALLDLAWLNQLAAEAQLPSGSVFTLRDRNGFILVRYPNPERWVGQSVPDAPLLQAIRNQHGEGTSEAHGLDGILRLFAFVPLGGAVQRGDVYVSVGIPAAVAFAEANYVLTRNLAVLGVVAVLTLTAAWVGVSLTVLQPVNILVSAAQRLAAGELNARAGVRHGPGELSHLAQTFDEMADSLERGIAEHERAEEEIRRLNRELRQRVVERTAELQQSEEELIRLSSAVKTSIDSIVLTDIEGKIIEVNEATLEMYGTDDKRDLIGKSSFETIAPEDREEAFAGMREVLEKGYIKGREYYVIVKNGNIIPVEMSVSIIKDAEGKPIGFVGISRDVTERKQAEETLKTYALQLEAANAELEAFSYSVSHDLRAPLRAMAGFSRILQEDYAHHLPPQAGRYLQIIQDNAQQMGRLIDALLAFSRLGRHPLKRQSVAPADLVRQVLDELHDEQTGRQVEISVGDLPVCQADPALLKQVFVNLLSNALKFTRQREVAHIEIGCQCQESETIYFVKDNGAGFDARYADKLFGVFQRLHRAEEYEGTGVGLATVQRILHRHGGRVWAEAEVGKGATFYFTIGEDKPPPFPPVRVGERFAE